MPKVALAQDLLERLPKFSSREQGLILKWTIRFQSDPTSSGINYEKINGARDPNLRSVRINQDFRGIVFKPPMGDLYLLMYVDHHDAAYRWAENKRLEINPTTGALQVFTSQAVVEPLIPKGPAPTKSTLQSDLAAPIGEAISYTALTDTQLQSLGVPTELLDAVKRIRTDLELDALEPHLPREAYEGLFLVATGMSVTDVLSDRETRVDKKIDTADFASAIETPEALARFVVVDDEETTAAILNAPLAKWRVFLHPTQRKLAAGDRKGSMRVLGGAGTGKTVLAMHRAKWLAENRATPDRKVFFTTFTRNLAGDIEENLKSLCSPTTMQRIEVTNLDAWVHGFLRSHHYDHTIVYDRKDGPAKQAWDLALAVQDSRLGMPENFYEDELDQVVLPQGITTLDQYRQAKRTGRGVILNRSKRDAVWPVFEEYRTQLSSRKRKEVSDAFRDAAALLAERSAPYSAIIVDETQDFGPMALRLLRAMIKAGANDLFLVGDGHQRIYLRNKASMSACGIDIRGRSRKLYLNYRTTEEIRRHAIALLEGKSADDLDDGSDEIKRYKSISHGPIPTTKSCAHMEDALLEVIRLSKAANDSSRSICVIVPGNPEVIVIKKALEKSKVKTLVLDAGTRDNAETNAVRVATMHRAKGLEFDEVVLCLPRDLGSRRYLSENLEQLKYVALTRAKRVATTIEYG